MQDVRFRRARGGPIFLVLASMVFSSFTQQSAVSASKTEIRCDSVKVSVSEEGGIELALDGGRTPLASMKLLEAGAGEEPGGAPGPVSAARLLVRGENTLEMILADSGGVLRIALEPAQAEGTLPAGVRLSITPVSGGGEGLPLLLKSESLFMEFPLLGRAKRNPTSRITFAAYGQPKNLRADTLFDVETDRALVFSRPCRLDRRAFTQTVPEGGASILVIEDFYREGRGLEFYTPMDRSRFHRTPCGWCSWYHYYLNINEEEMLANTDWLARNLQAYGLEYIQLDDGFQLLAPDGEQARSWTEWNPKFPGGPRLLAGYIHDKGFKAGLWLTPFSQGDEALVEAHPDWFLREENGGVVKTFKGALTLDATNDDALAGWFVPLFAALAAESGFDYFKIDGQPTVVQAYREHQDRFHAPMEPEAAYRRGLQTIRDTIGPDRFLLNCWGTAAEGIGLVNGARTGGDVYASWKGILPAREATRAWYYTHNICWHADPDVLCVRPPLTLQQARMWASLLGLTGQLLMASDKMYELPAERVEILERVLPVLSVFPMEFYPLAGDQLDIIDLKIDKRFVHWDVVGLFNWSREDRTMEVTFEELGLEEGSYLLYDFWNRKFLGMTDGGFALVVPKQSCRVVSVTEAAAERPTLLGSTRHITMGGVDLMGLEWDQRQKRLDGMSRMLVKDDPYVLGFYVPEGTRQVQFAFSMDAWPLGENEGRFWKVEYTPRENGRVNWQIRFIGERMPIETTCGRPVPVGEPVVTPHTISFAWKTEGEAPAAYRVQREGADPHTVMDGRWIESGLEPGTAYTFTVTVLPFPGQFVPDEASFSLEATTAVPPPPPVEPDVFLTDLKPVSASQGWGTLGIDRSTEGNPLTIGGEVFARGLGTHAESAIEYKIEPGYKLFIALAGVDEEAAYGSVTFEVYLDGEKAFVSPLLYSGDPAHPVSVPVEGKQRLRLVVTNGGDDIHYDHADWARAGFVRR